MPSQQKPTDGRQRPQYFNRPHPDYSPKTHAHAGVVQRCRRDLCPPIGSKKRCTEHSWSYVLEVRVAVNKRQRITRAGFATADAAETDREALKTQHEGGATSALDNARLTMADWLPRWLSDRLEDGTLAPNTVLSYRQLIDDYLVPHLGRVLVTKLHQRDITAAYKAIRARRSDLSRSTFQRVHAVLSAAIRDAIKDGVREGESPCPHARIPADPPDRARYKHQPWTPAEARRFFEAIADHPAYPLYWLIAHTGMRRGEAAGLRWDDLDLDAGQVRIAQQTRVMVGRQAVVKEGGKTAAATRLLGIDSDTVAVLATHRIKQRQAAQAWAGRYDPAGWVFALEDGSPLDPESISYQWRVLVRKHGARPQKLHGLRHLYVWLLAQAGAPLDIAAKMVGHRDVNLTHRTYGGLFADAAQQWAERAAAVIREAK